MLLNRTIAQLDIGYVPQEQAADLGHLGYLQWLGALKGSTSYHDEAREALNRARPFVSRSPGLATFYHLVAASLQQPLSPLTLRLPKRGRKGGARARRAAL